MRVHPSLTRLVNENTPGRPLVLLAHGLYEAHVLEPLLEPRDNAKAGGCLADMLPEIKASK